MGRLIEVLKESRVNGRAVGQFNFSTLDQFQGIVKAAKELNAPVICGTSGGEADFFGIKEAVSMARIARERENINLFLNFDHGKDVDLLKKAVDEGYDMIHFDGSDFPFEKNIELTKEIVGYAKERGVVVEGEVSKIGGKSTVSDEKMEEVTLTSVEKVAKFVKDTGIDCIAFDVGSVHGVYKDSPKIFPERVDELLNIISCLVVLHGGSGVSESDIKTLIERGVVKINVNTELRLAWKEAIGDAFEENPKEITPYKILPLSRDAVCDTVKNKINIFNFAQKRV